MSFFAKRIIPCLDVDNGRVVKGVNFVGLRDAGDPVEVAKRYNIEGADEITFLDIGASHEGRDTIVDVILSIKEQKDLARSVLLWLLMSKELQMVLIMFL